MLALAVVIALPILLVSVAQSIVRADGMQAIRSAFVFLPLAAILSAVGPAMAQMLINISDWMSAALGANASADAQKFMSDAGSALAGLGAGSVNPAAPVFGVLLGALIVTLGALSIWLELLLRAAAIYISVLFLPLALSAMIWPAGWRWCRRLIEFLIAIIFAKVFIVAIINLAAAGLARGGLGDKFEGVLAGGALLLMAAFTPVALLKLIPLAEAAVVTAGHQRAALRQATAGATALTTSSSVVSGMINTRFRTSAGAGPAAAAGFGPPAAAAAAGAAVVGTARNRATSSFADHELGRRGRRRGAGGPGGDPLLGPPVPGQRRRQRRRQQRRHQAAEAARPVRRRARVGCVAPWRSATGSGRWSGAAGSARSAPASWSSCPRPCSSPSSWSRPSRAASGCWAA